jgi:hypothetical protein
MSDEQAWDEDLRIELREQLRETVMGELRLRMRGGPEIVDFCREVFIEDQCPKNEWGHFTQFVSEELTRAEARLEAESAGWPERTDCDRLDRAEVAMRERGILFWQASPCCDTCTGGELPDRIDFIDSRVPGFRARLRGYAFFIDQGLAEMLAESSEATVFLAYGWFIPAGAEVSDEEHTARSLDIGHEVCECLRQEGLVPMWAGDFAKKIGVSVNWQRRGPLE